MKCRWHESVLVLRVHDLIDFFTDWHQAFPVVAWTYETRRWLGWNYGRWTVIRAHASHQNMLNVWSRFPYWHAYVHKLMFTNHIVDPVFSLGKLIASLTCRSRNKYFSSLTHDVQTDQSRLLMRFKEGTYECTLILTTTFVLVSGWNSFWQRYFELNRFKFISLADTCQVILLSLMNLKLCLTPMIV